MIGMGKFNVDVDLWVLLSLITSRRILQKLTPWYDGVPSVQQCPIAPGSSFTYSFIADLYGTTVSKSCQLLDFHVGTLWHDCSTPRQELARR